MDHDSVTDETHACPAGDLALRDIRASDGAVARRPEGDTHFGGTEDALDLGRGEASHQDRLDIIE